LFDIAFEILRRTTPPTAEYVGRARRWLNTEALKSPQR
jgi:hypothetical protein